LGALAHDRIGQFIVIDRSALLAQVFWIRAVSAFVCKAYIDWTY
jgi:hypothetical protein